MINLYHVLPGQRLKLKDGRTGDVVENMGDGQWVEVRLSDQDAGDDPELVHSQDIAELLENQG